MSWEPSRRSLDAYVWNLERYRADPLLEVRCGWAMADRVGKKSSRIEADAYFRTSEILRQTFLVGMYRKEKQ